MGALSQRWRVSACARAVVLFGQELLMHKLNLSVHFSLAQRCAMWQFAFSFLFRKNIVSNKNLIKQVFNLWREVKEL